MVKNMGSSDKVIRLVVAIALVILYFTETLTGTAGVIALVVAAVFTLTSLVGVCPLYSVFGIKTCKVKTT